MTYTLRLWLALLTVLGVAVLFTFTYPHLAGVQHGFRGTGMDQIFDEKVITAEAPANALAPVLPPTHAGPPARTVYKNVQVLGGLDVGAFTRLMASLTTWVAPKQGCNYCHIANNMASDAIYTKVVSRRMIQMTQNINANWTQHVQATGVTCWTCHRGNPVPSHVWFNDPGPAHFNGLAEVATGKNHPIAEIGQSSLPSDPFTPYLEGKVNIRVQGETALPDGNNSSIKEAEWTYALMMHFSQSLGVNCSYCHNTRAFSDWSQSAPQRVSAWWGIRMARDLNDNYLEQLHDVWPAYRLGPAGDSPKLNCATCHQGVYKPLFGKSPAQGFPELQKVSAGLDPKKPYVPAGAPAPVSVSPSDQPASAPPAAPAGPDAVPTPPAATPRTDTPKE